MSFPQHWILSSTTLHSRSLPSKLTLLFNLIKEMLTDYIFSTMFDFRYIEYLSWFYFKMCQIVEISSRRLVTSEMVFVGFIVYQIKKKVNNVLYNSLCTVLGVHRISVQYCLYPDLVHPSTETFYILVQGLRT